MRKILIKKIQTGTLKILNVGLFSNPPNLSRWNLRRQRAQQRRTDLLSEQFW